MPDSPTAEEIGRDTRDQEIIELATRLFPEDGYESDHENNESSVFQLLCEVSRTYTRLVGDPEHTVTETDEAMTLQSVLENIAPSYGVVRS